MSCLIPVTEASSRNSVKSRGKFGQRKESGPKSQTLYQGTERLGSMPLVSSHTATLFVFFILGTTFGDN